MAERRMATGMNRTAAAVVLAVSVTALAGCAATTETAPTPTAVSTPSAEAAPSPSPSETEAPPAASPEESFMAALRERPSLADATQQADQSVFIEWGQAQCDALREGGAEGMLGSVAAWGFTGGDVADLEEGLLDELHVTEAAATYLCPDLKPEFDEFLVLLERSLTGGG